MRLNILGTSPLLLIILSTHFPPVLVSTVAVIISGGGEWDFFVMFGGQYEGAVKKRR
jgi:hypothetical protein